MGVGACTAIVGKVNAAAVGCIRQVTFVARWWNTVEVAITLVHGMCAAWTLSRRGECVVRDTNTDGGGCSDGPCCLTGAVGVCTEYGRIDCARS
jgi:hypothetical protein